ncbi:uncharacterized protein LOC141527721 [Cotesia typhae]|uniref:uncharacterized protein LOC141527721 n=1 Tax=Cotesia typhae TaxID=2053667 RepID=UPI003D69C104
MGIGFTRIDNEDMNDSKDGTKKLSNMKSDISTDFNTKSETSKVPLNANNSDPNIMKELEEKEKKKLDDKRRDEKLRKQKDYKKERDRQKKERDTYYRMKQKKERLERENAALKRKEEQRIETEKKVYANVIKDFSRQATFYNKCRCNCPNPSYREGHWGNYRGNTRRKRSKNSIARAANFRRARAQNFYGPARRDSACPSCFH